MPMSTAKIAAITVGGTLGGLVLLGGCVGLVASQTPTAAPTAAPEPTVTVTEKPTPKPAVTVTEKPTPTAEADNYGAALLALAWGQQSPSEKEDICLGYNLLGPVETYRLFQEGADEPLPVTLDDVETFFDAVC